MRTTWMTLAVVGALGAGCGKKEQPAAQPEPAKAPAEPAKAEPANPSVGSNAPVAGPAWAKDGAMFDGAPQPGRGGQYRYALCPNGGFARWCLDGWCERGTWKLEPDAVVLTLAEPAGKQTKLVLSKDGNELSDGSETYKLAGPADKAACGA